MNRIRVLLLALVFAAPALADHGMDQERMERIVIAMASSSKGERGVVEFVYNNVSMYLISDVQHNRMRIVAPIVEYQTLTREQLDATLESNYHKALDARYALSKGVLFSVYIHSLAELHDGQIRTAVRQVANLALSFGSEYSSGSLSFGGDN